ncbi:GNAT family N-acetyltransferase [Neobacillus sp. 3P2-tot-E-2]|uniref:GNAT family N-acetyltransferase n=1 Tax=Neobacillus sp. 3P2-tot-E-2 TaxID=3132212 RepID=UPI0039A1D069
MEFITTQQWDEDLWQKTRDIYNVAFGEHATKPEKVIQNMFARGLSALHVLKENDVVLAMALTGAMPNSSVLLLDYLAVRKNLRGHGIGKGFFDYLLEWASSQPQFKRILVEVECDDTPQNHARIQFWEKCGFQLLDDYKHCYKWGPQHYMAMVHYLKGKPAIPLKGEDCLKYMASFHKESYKQNFKA